MGLALHVMCTVGRGEIGALSISCPSKVGLYLGQKAMSSEGTAEYGLWFSIHWERSRQSSASTRYVKKSL